MNIHEFPRINPDGTHVLSMGEAIKRYKDGTLDPKTKKMMDLRSSHTLDRLQKYFQDNSDKLAEALIPFFMAQAKISRARAKKVATSFAMSPQVQRALSFMRGGDILFRAYFTNSLAGLHDRMPEALLLLGQHGWYLDLEMPVNAIWEIRDELRAGRLDDVDNGLCEYFECRLEEIESALLDRFQTRARIIKAAFSAHHRGEYELAIPVTLIQVDGICKELLGRHLFLSKKGKPEIADSISDLLPGTFSAMGLSPFMEKLPINMSEKQRPKDFGGLNRHLVLHGISLDYATRLNAYKAISLLNCVAQTMTSDIDEQGTQLVLASPFDAVDRDRESIAERVLDTAQ